MTTEELISLINHTLGAGTAGLSDIPSNPACLTIFPEKLPDVCRFLHQEDQTQFDLLECITGIDNGLENGTLEVIYHLYSIVYDQQIALRIILPRTTVTGDLPEVHSVSGIWKTAEWLERETYDLMGIKFTDHPDLRRILLPADWKGHPLRKDYQDGEFYHGVKIKY